MLKLVDYSRKDILKRHWNRTQRARDIDRKKKAKRTFNYTNLRGRNLWYAHPELYDLEGIDSLNASMERQIPQWDLLKQHPKQYHHKARKAPQKHTSREKQKVRYIMQTTRSNYSQARGLLKRAESKGVSWDLIDWDRLQGRDLSYNAKVKRLEGMIGQTHTTASFYNMADIKLMESKFNEQQEAFFKKLRVKSPFI